MPDRHRVQALTQIEVDEWPEADPLAKSPAHCEPPCVLRGLRVLTIALACT
jgi:hypothetical protein